LPIKTFVAGTLSSSDVNTYLMNQAVITCTSATRPGSPPTGMVIYETDTNLFNYWNGTVWTTQSQMSLATIAASPVYGTPTSGTDTSATIANVTVPTWATKAQVSWSVNGITTSAAEPTVTAQLKIGSAAGTARNIHGHAAAVGRFSLAYNETITGLATGVQSVTILCHWTSGTNTFNIDANSYVTVGFIFQP
jgi:hypothetical protein